MWKGLRYETNSHFHQIHAHVKLTGFCEKNYEKHWKKIYIKNHGLKLKNILICECFFYKYIHIYTSFYPEGVGRASKAFPTWIAQS